MTASVGKIRRSNFQTRRRSARGSMEMLAETLRLSASGAVVTPTPSSRSLMSLSMEVGTAVLPLLNSESDISAASRELTVDDPFQAGCLVEMRQLRSVEGGQALLIKNSIIVVELGHRVIY